MKIHPSDKNLLAFNMQQFLNGFCACLSVLLLALLAAHMSPAVQDSFVVWLAPNLTADGSGLNDEVVLLKKQVETLQTKLREGEACLARQHELQQELTTAHHEMHALRPMAEARAALCAACCSQATRPVSCTHWCTSSQ